MTGTTLPRSRPSVADTAPGALASGAPLASAAHQAFWLLRIIFTVAPILVGIDKFFDWTVNWPDYLAGWVNDIVPGNAQDLMHVVGAVEIAAGLLVAFAPRVGAFVVAAWLAGIVVNLATKEPPEYYDIALRDLGLMVGALALGRLALAVVPARRAVRRRGLGTADAGDRPGSDVSP